ncbi:hypothetical protein ACQJBY_039135 [Aegilops geniculata]
MDHAPNAAKPSHSTAYCSPHRHRSYPLWISTRPPSARSRCSSSSYASSLPKRDAGPWTMAARRSICPTGCASTIRGRLPARASAATAVAWPWKFAICR